MKKGMKYDGHAEGTRKPANAPSGYESPASHAMLSKTPSNVNVKAPEGIKPGSGD